MKKLNKLFLALAGISAVSAGLAVGVSGFNSEAQIKADVVYSPLKRLYIVNSNTDTGWNANTNLYAYIFGSTVNSAENSSAWNNSKQMVCVDSSANLFYVDIPTDATLIIRNRNDSDDTWQNQTIDIDLKASAYVDVWTSSCLQIETAMDNYKHKASEVVCSLTTPAQLGHLLGWFVTCDSSDVYGFNAYKQLHDTFFVTASAGLTDNTEALVSDYDYSNSGVYNLATHSYVSLNNRSVFVSIKDKITMMKLNYDRGSNHVVGAIAVAPAYSSSTLILGTLCATAVIAAGGYFFVRKRKID